MNAPQSVSAGVVAARWWRELQPRPDGSGGDRASLARLRRASTARDAVEEPATLELCRDLGWGWQTLDRVAVTAAVLAHVREDAQGPPVARQLGVPAPGQPQIMSPLRFLRMMQAETDHERLAAFRRAVALAGGRLNVLDLGQSLLGWNDERKRRWLFAYHDAPSPAASSEDHP
jgi:CRISPR system Cascade subunit CasB